jgi:hypothetical protein
MIVDTTGNNDWKTVSFTHIPDTAASTSDDSFTPGQKQDTTCPTVEGHKNPPKDDFTDIASYTEVNATTGATYLYGATIRYAANGNASENIELKQGTGGLCPGSTTLLARVAGDKLIAIDYVSGGPQFHVLTWVTSGACFVGSNSAPCWGATVVEVGPPNTEGAVNASPITAANNPISNVALVAGKFAEFGINLAGAGIIPSGSCKSFSQTVWESRSSGSSFVSSTKDISIEDQDINSCASLGVRKVGSDGGSQAGAVFTLYEGSDTTGAVVGSCTVDGNGDCLPSFADLVPGTYTIDESNTPIGYTKDPSLPFTFTLAQGEDKSLLFTDVAQTGAIKVTKTRKHAADGPGNHPHQGVSFTVDGVTQQTDANGETCFDGLSQAEYTVTETVPGGYSGTASKQVTVDNPASCSDAAYGGEAVSFHNEPLTNVTVTVDSQVTGGTSSTIDCEPTDNDPDAGPGDDITVTLSDLEPTVLTCTIDIDP